MGFCSLFIEFVCTFSLALYYIIRSCFSWFLPTKRKSIKDDIILITGGGKGLGRLLAVEVAKHKPSHIIIWGRHGETLSATAKAVSNSGVKCTFMVCDLSIREQIQKRAKEIRDQIGDVTIIMNNAGVVYGNDVLESDPDDMEKTVKVNSLAHFWILRAFLPTMKERNHGHIVTVNSMLGCMGLAGAADYCASKYAASGLSESLKLELTSEGKTGVHITSVHPYVVNTDMFAGCDTRFPWLFPTLDKHFVVEKIVDAMLTNTFVVLLPWTMYPFIFIKSLLPVNCLQVIQKFLGADRAMHTFHGRQRLNS